MAKSICEFLGLMVTKIIRELSESIDMPLPPNAHYEIVNNAMTSLKENKWYESLYDVVIGNTTAQAIRILNEFDVKLNFTCWDRFLLMH